MKKFYLLTSILILLFTSCSQKVIIKSIIPAQIDDRDVKKVSIEKFKNGTISLSSNIKSEMSNIYFNIVNREESEQILKEQKLQDAGLVNVDPDKIFGLEEINSIISGKINHASYDKNRFYEQRINYKKCIKYKTNKNAKKYCSQYQKYNIQCINHNYNIDATITISRIVNSDIIYSKIITNHKQ